MVMRDGKFVKAGIGLSTFIGPFDQVSIFPSRLNKVEIVTDQITKEMQGVEVKSSDFECFGSLEGVALEP